MEIVEDVEITKVERHHIFYCDKCMKKIAESYEEDFFYQSVDPYKFIVTKGLEPERYSKKMHLCISCVSKEVDYFNRKFKEFCEDVGLIKEN